MNSRPFTSVLSVAPRANAIILPAIIEGLRRTSLMMIAIQRQCAVDRGTHVETQADAARWRHRADEQASSVSINIGNTTITALCRDTFGMNVLAYDPTPRQQNGELYAEDASTLLLSGYRRSAVR